MFFYEKFFKNYFRGSAFFIVPLARAAEIEINAPIILHPENMESDLYISGKSAISEWKNSDNRKIDLSYICIGAKKDGKFIIPYVGISHGNAITDYYSYNVNFASGKINNTLHAMRYFRWNREFAHETISCIQDVPVTKWDTLTYHIQYPTKTEFQLPIISNFSSPEKIILEKNFENTEKKISINRNINPCTQNDYQSLIILATLLNGETKDFSEQWKKYESENPGKEEIEIPNNISTLKFITK